MHVYVIMFICLGAGAGHGAVADSSPGAGPPPAGLPEDHLRWTDPQCTETAAQGSLQYSRINMQSQ